MTKPNQVHLTERRGDTPTQTSSLRYNLSLNTTPSKGRMKFKNKEII